LIEMLKRAVVVRALSFPCNRESTRPEAPWTPAFAGVTWIWVFQRLGTGWDWRMA
jgi:hypothetical protein